MIFTKDTYINLLSNKTIQLSKINFSTIVENKTLLILIQKRELNFLTISARF
jgi:hypothetical protein